MSDSTIIHDLIRDRFAKLDLTSAFTLVSLARKGIKTKIFYDFAESVKMPEKNLAELINISSRTVSNYKEKQKPLDPIQSEHLLKLITLFGKGEEVFGNIDEFNYWLNKPFWNAREKPIAWLITPGGVDLLMDELERLAYGYAV